MNDTLALVAEFSIGLAGFSGIVAAIGRIELKVFRFRIKALIKTAFIPGFCALVGLMLLRVGLDDSIATRVTSAVLGISVLVNLITILREAQKFEAAEKSQLSRKILLFNVVTYSLNVLAQFYCVLTETPYAEAILVAGLIHQLLSAAITFSSIVELILMDRFPVGDGASRVEVDE